MLVSGSRYILRHYLWDVILLGIPLPKNPTWLVVSNNFYMFTPILGEMIQFDEIYFFQMGLVQPPTTYQWNYNNYKWPKKWVIGVIPLQKPY